MYSLGIYFTAFFLFAFPIAGSCFSVLTVSKRGAGQYTSLSDALRAAASDDTIRILDSETYSEDFPTITLNHLTLEAAAGQSPLLERSAQGPDSPPEVFRFAPPAGSGTLVIRGASPAQKMTLLQSWTNQPVVGLGNPDNATDRLILENLVLLMSPSIDSHMLVLKNAGNHTLRHLNFQGRLADCHKAVLYCACSGNIVFEDCDIVADGHNVVLIYGKHSSGASGNITMNRCVLEPGPYSIHPTGISGQGGIRGNAEGLLILNDCHMSVGTGVQGTPFFEMNSPATVQFNRPVFTGEMGWCAFRVPGGGEQGPDITIAGTPRQKVDFNPFWNPNTATIAFRLATGSLRLVDCSATAPRTGWVPMVDLRGEGPLTGPVTITVDRCIWSNGAGAFLLDTTDGAGNAVASNFPVHVAATNSIWIGGGGEGALISMYSSKRTVAGTLRFNHCTLSGPTGNILVAVARQQDGCKVSDELRGEFSIFNDTGTNAAGSVSLVGQKNIITHFGSILQPSQPSFLGGQPADTIVQDPHLDPTGHLTAQSLAALGTASGSSQSTDVDGDSRPWGGTWPDIGADETNLDITPTPSPTPSLTPTSSPTPSPTPPFEPNILTVAKTVPAQYSTFSAALADARNGNTIRFLDSETYSESIPKITLLSLTIEALPGQSPIIENNNFPVFTGAIVYAPPSEGTLTIRGSSPVRKMTIRHNSSNQGAVIINDEGQTPPAKANLILENLILEISPTRKGYFLGLGDGGNHQIRNIELKGRPAAGPRVSFNCAGSALFEDCDMRSPGHDFLVAFQNHKSGAPGTLILRRCVLTPYPGWSESPGVAGVRSSTGTGRLVLEDCRISSGGGETYHDFLSCNMWPTVEIIQPTIVGGLGRDAFSFGSMLGGKPGPTLWIEGRTPWSKVDLDPMWEGGTQLFVRMPWGKLRLQDIRSTRQGLGITKAVQTGLSNGSMGAPLEIEMERCEWLGGTGAVFLGPFPSSDFTQPISFTARNTIWAGALTQPDPNTSNLFQLGGVLPLPESRPASRIHLIHCTVHAPGFQHLFYAEQQFGDAVEAINTIIDDSGVRSAASSSAPALTGSGNLLAHRGTAIPPGGLSFPMGEPPDTIVADPLLDSRGRLTLQSPALAVLHGASPSFLDVDGDSRPQPRHSEWFDIGADEYNETGQTGRVAAILQPGDQVRTSIPPIQFYDTVVSAPLHFDGAGLVARLQPLDTSDNWILLGQKNALPTLDSALWKSTEKTQRGTIEILIPSPEPGAYYFTVYHLIPPLEQPRPFLFEVMNPNHYISRSTPDFLKVGSYRDFWIQGLGLDGTLAGELRDSDSSLPLRVPFMPQHATWWETNADLRDANEGPRDLIIQLQDEDTSLPLAVTLLTNVQERFEAYIEIPQQVRKDRIYTARIYYANMGTTPIRSPMLTIVSHDKVEFRELCSTSFSPKELSLFAIGPDWPPDILAPGVNHVQPIQFRCTGGAPHQIIKIGVRIQKPSERPVQWTPAWLQALGADWDEYLANLGTQARRFWLAGRKTPCLSELYDQLLKQAVGTPEFLVAGRLVSNETGAALPNVPMILRDVGEDPVVFRFGQSASPEGIFYFSNIPQGDYELFATGYILDYEWPVYISNQDLFAMTVRAIPVPSEDDVAVSAKPGSAQNDFARSVDAAGSGQTSPPGIPSLLTDSEGNTYLLWTEEGSARIAVREQEAWRQVVAEAQQNTSTTELVAAWAPSLAGYSPEPGLVMVRASGDQKNSRLACCLATWKTDKSRMTLSAWETLTSDTLADRFPCVTALPEGNAMVLWLQRDETKTDDSDLYSSTILFSEAKPIPSVSRTGEEFVSLNTEKNLNADPVLLSEDKFTYEVNFSKGTTVPKWLPFLDGPYKYELRGRGTGVLGDCFRAGQGTFGAKAKITNNFEFSGDAGGNAKWKYNCDNKRFVFDSGSLNGQIQGEAKIPFTYTTPYVGTTLVPLLRSIGMEIGMTYRIAVGFGLKFLDESFNWPYQGSSINLTALVGLFLRNDEVSPIRFASHIWDFNADATGGGTVKLEWERLRVKGVVTGEALLRVVIKLGKEAIRYECKWKTNPREFLRRSLAETPWSPEIWKAESQDDNFEESLVYEYDPLVGTSLVGREGNMVLAGKVSNLEMEGAPSVAVSAAKEILVAWTHESPFDSPLLGTELWVAAWNGEGFDPPQSIHGAQDFNAEANLKFDSENNPWVLYSSADGSGWDAQSDPSSVIEAMLETDIYYSRRVGGEWTLPAPLAVSPGTDFSPSLAAGPNGQMVVAWIHRGDSPETDQVLVSRWNSQTDEWIEPVVVTEGLRVQSPKVTYHQDNPMVVWIQDADGLSQSDGDLKLHESLFVNASWTLPVIITPATLHQSQTPGGIVPLSLSDVPIPPPPLLQPISDFMTAAQKSSPIRLVGLSDEERFEKCCDQTPTPTPPPIITPMPHDNCPTNTLCCVDTPDGPVYIKDGPLCGGWNGSELILPNDPNEKVGPVGIGASRRVPTAKILDYIIYFENVTTATAAAQEIVITDILDPNLDTTSLQFLEVSIGSRTIVSSYPGITLHERRDWPDWLGRVDTWWGDFHASLDPVSHTLTWRLRILDPATGELPEDVLAGILPPNDESGRGQGYVRFRIRCRSDIAQGTRIYNQASIVFDTEAPILTPLIFNTIEDSVLEPPANPNPADQSMGISISAALSWTGSEDTANFDVFLWELGNPQPDYPTIANLVHPYCQPLGRLKEKTLYFWKVIARNAYFQSESPVWQFTTHQMTKPELWMLF